ncbi:MAG: hypothetical protein M3R51_08835 [Candidatus Eremiobacteraeota bacterium]|nr:hypothetical protein [Candidatus Eremiobacteraeota bacterium]
MDMLDAWQPRFPPGRIDAVYMHWSGGDYASVFAAYHFCIVRSGSGVSVAQTRDLRANMRDISGTDDYAAHTYGRNSFAAGIAIMGMRAAAPDDFGLFPLTCELIEGLARVGGALVRAYRIPTDAQHVLTHAEAAIEDGYFGAEDDQRWDIARLHQNPAPLSAREAIATGDDLRCRIARYAKRR